MVEAISNRKESKVSVSDAFAYPLDYVASPKPASFHVFEYRGRKLFYDINTSAVLEVNKFTAFSLLKELEESGDDIASIKSTMSTSKASAAKNVIEEIGRMKSAGLFTPDIPLTEEEVEASLESLVNHHPNKILLMVSQSCNFRCVYCYAVENNFPDEGKLMDEEIALKAIDHLFKVSGSRKYLTVSFFGGEPLLNFPLIRKVVNYSLDKAEKEGHEVEFLMSTNASLITDEIADYLVEHEFSMLVSLDGPPEVHNRFRPTKNGGPSHHLSLKGIYRLVRRYSRPHYVKVKAVLNHHSHNLLAVADYLEDLGLNNIAIGGSRERPWGCRDFDLYGSDFDALEGQVETLLDRVLDRLDNGRATGYNPFFHTLRSISMTSKLRGIVCGVGRNCNAVSVEGDIYPCHRYVGMHPYIIGNVFNGLDTEKTLEYYRSLCRTAALACRTCWLRNICGGDCPWHVSKEDGSIWPPHPRGCEDARRSAERAIWLYYELEKRHPDYLKRITAGLTN